ncbi:hypothetical protein ASD16_09535 [Cellulomonas sp. Root485]|uniref:hypothetical protein n=1 Tax=Cellulomonas sp. Root485 TaxID=1736546 RepID=UPI000701647F|nr:hypothetical protein [Cellulomonas sp. Root485]KQY22847.1 hypothetical protein ASD16_09535 [Cellulomonas sp. Root485]
MKRILLSTLLALAVAPLTATVAWSSDDTRPPDEVTAYFEDGAAAAFAGMTSDPAVLDTKDGASRTASPSDGEVSFGPPRTVHQFTHAYTRGDTRGDIIEPDGTWIAPVLDSLGDSVGTALVWYPPGQPDPEIAAIEWDPQLGERLASAPADPLVHVGEDDAWFTLKNNQLRGLDGSHVSVVTYGRALASHLAVADTSPDPDSDQVGGGPILVSDSVIFRPRGIATALAIGAALVLAGALLRRRHRGSHPLPLADEESS